MVDEKPLPAAPSDATWSAMTTLSHLAPPHDLARRDGAGRINLEIERKFLVVNDAWRRDALRSEHLRDGLVARFGEGKVRVRLTDNRASLTIKGPRSGISRQEFEYEIPRTHAEQMLQTLCLAAPVLEKVRHTVPFGGLTWSVDVYMGPLAGIVFAEVELEHPDQPLQLPPWVGEEVTHNPRFRKHALLPESGGVVQDESLRV